MGPLVRALFATATRRYHSLSVLLRARVNHRQATYLWASGENSRALVKASRAVELFGELPPGSGEFGKEGLAAALTLSHYHAEFGDFAAAASVSTSALAALPAADLDATSYGRVALTLQLADTQRRRANYVEAERTLVAAARGVDSTAPATLFCDLHNAWGLVCKDGGRYGEAVEHYSLALERCPASDLNRRAIVQHNLAGLAHVQGNFADAVSLARTAVQLRREAGSDATALAADATVLGAALVGLGCDSEAESLFRNAIVTWSDRFGSDHYEIAVNLHNLAAVQQRRGAADAAVATLEESLRIKTQVLGSRHPEVAAILNDLACLHADQGRRDLARRTNEEALERLAVTLGVDHPLTRRCRDNLEALRSA